jgi:hypothetical protein
MSSKSPKCQPTLEAVEQRALADMKNRLRRLALGSFVVVVLFSLFTFGLPTPGLRQRSD